MNIVIVALHFNCRIQCETDEVVKTLCSALALAGQWRIKQPENMGAESWTALNEVFNRGKLDTVFVTELALGSASDQQISLLWQTTEECVRLEYVDDCYITVAKSEGDAGLKKLLTKKLIRTEEVDLKEVQCETDEAVKTLCADLALAQKWRIGQLQLPDNMGAEGWEALIKVTSKGKVDRVTTTEEMIEQRYLELENLVLEKFSRRRRRRRRSSSSARR